MFLSFNYEKKIFKQFQNTHYVFVDEISMVKEIFYRFFVLLKRYVPHIKFIIIGDFDQLKPVKDIWEGEYRDSRALHQLCDGHKLELQKCRRSDEKLFNLYDGVRKGQDIDISQFSYQQLTPLNIAYTHTTRKFVNQQCMEKYVGDKPFLTCSHLERNIKTQKVKIFQGMPIVSYKNDDKLDICNSEIFKVHSINTEDNTFMIYNDDQPIEFKASDFKYFFYPAFSITIHTSQGCTFNEPYNFPGKQTLYQLAKKEGVKVTHKQIDKFLSKQQVAQVYRKDPPKKGFIVAFLPDERVQMDLIDMTNFARKNKGYGWIFFNCRHIHTQSNCLPYEEERH